MRRRARQTVGVALLACVLPATLPAQSVRVSGVTTMRYIGIRPLTADSVLAADVPGTTLIRETVDGHTVRCVEGATYCRFFRSADALAAVPASQDLSVSAWGFGRGLRVFARARARASLAAGEAVWPRADDPLDILAAYAELDRPAFRIRAGRQWATTGLGFYNFDGASLVVRPVRPLRLEGFGGWSLVRGLNEPITGGALAAVESFVPEDRGLLAGVRVQFRPSAALDASAVYQREIRSDRAALYSERAAAGLAWRTDVTTVETDLEADVALGVVNEARARATVHPSRTLGLDVFARRHRPYFDLWTIWGVFDPVGFDELGAGATWRGGPYTLEAHGSWRTYPETGASHPFTDFNSDGWRLRASAGARLRDWTLNGWYVYDLGFGAAGGQGGLRAERPLARDAFAALTAHAFQRAYEFRVRSGTVIGLAGDVGVPLGSRARVLGGLTGYLHTGSGADVDWSQLRGSLRLEWTLGAEPGLPEEGGG